MEGSSTTMEQHFIKLKQLAEQIASRHNADIFYYSGPISRVGYELVTQRCIAHEPKKNAYLILATYGGDADAAYRIARALRHNYRELYILIPRQCKSAGTLLVIGATSLIISDRGELGPLDVQISKPDEIFERGSGLDIMQALNVMQQQAMDTFGSYLLDIKLNIGITVRTAAEIASKLAVGLFAPIYAQIDPLKLGEVQRAITIAYEYGERLNNYDQNLKQDALKKLVTSYPSHGFVIDRKEARGLFHKVAASEDDECQLGELLCNWWLPEQQHSQNFPIVLNLLNNFSNLQQESNDEPTNQIQDITNTTPARDNSTGNTGIQQENG